MHRLGANRLVHRNLNGRGSFGGLKHGSVLLSAGGPSTPPWYQDIVDIIGPSGFFASHDTGITEAVGQPVAAWRDVRGKAFLTQPGASSLRPIRFATHLRYDGVDDRHLADSAAPLFNGAHTVIIGFDDPDAVGTSARTLFAAANVASSGTFSQVSVNFSVPAPNATRQRYYLADSANITNLSLITASAGAGPYDIVFRSNGLGLEARADFLANPLVQIGSSAPAPPLAETFTLFALGVRRLGALPTQTQFWQGNIRYIIIAGFALSPAELEVVRTTLIARGLMS